MKDKAKNQPRGWRIVDGNDYPTASRAVRRTSFAGSGWSSRQVMLIGRLPVWLA